MSTLEGLMKVDASLHAFLRDALARAGDPEVQKDRERMSALQDEIKRYIADERLAEVDGSVAGMAEKIDELEGLSKRIEETAASIETAKQVIGAVEKVVAITAQVVALVAG